MISLSNDQVRYLRLRAQCLALASPSPSSHRAESVAQVVKGVCGIQAQEVPAAALSIRVRSTGLVAADIEQARVQERDIIRTWGPRGTLHLLATEDLGWLLPLLGPVFVAGDRRRREELGLDADICARGINLIRNVLANQGSLTRAELVEQLATHGLRLEGQARPHLLYRAALEGIICLGPDRGTEPTYVLLSDWVDQKFKASPLSEEAAHVELARRYLAAYGPTTPNDQAAWSGMPLGKTRPAWHSIADQLMEVEVEGNPAWMLKSRADWLDEFPPPAPIVRLLPRYDTYLLGYQKRDLAIPPQYAKRINAGGGIIHPAVMVDGRVVGTWKSARKSNHLDVMVEPFDQLSPQIYPALKTDITDLSRFLGTPIALHVMEFPQ